MEEPRYLGSESHFPGDAAAAGVPEGPSIARSTPAAIAREASFADSADPSGRAFRGVNQDGYRGTAGTLTRIK